MPLHPNPQHRLKPTWNKCPATTNLQKRLKRTWLCRKTVPSDQGERQTPGECLLQNDPSNMCARVRASEAKRFPGSGECWAHFHPPPQPPTICCCWKLSKYQSGGLFQRQCGSVAPTRPFGLSSLDYMQTQHQTAAHPPRGGGGGELMLLCPHGINMTSQIRSTIRSTIRSKIKSKLSQTYVKIKSKLGQN